MRSVKGKDTESSNKEIEMSMDMVYTDNPLQNASDNKDSESNSNTDNRVYDLELENTDLKTRNTALEERVKELESRFENKADDKSADL